VAKNLLEDHVAGEEESEADRDHEEDVGPGLLRGGGHELGVIEAEEEADGKNVNSSFANQALNQVGQSLDGEAAGGLLCSSGPYDQDEDGDLEGGDGDDPT